MTPQVSALGEGALLLEGRSIAFELRGKPFDLPISTRQVSARSVAALGPATCGFLVARSSVLVGRSRLSVPLDLIHPRDLPLSPPETRPV